MTSPESPETLRRAIERLGTRGRGVRYPAELRERIVGFAASRVALGESTGRTAATLGVPACTLSLWLRGSRERDGGGGAFRAVVAHDAPRPRTMEILVETRSGVRITGLGIAELAELVRLVS